MRGDVWLHEWQFPDILCLDRAGILMMTRHGIAARRAGDGVVVLNCGDLLRLRQGTFVFGMPGLTTRFSSAPNVSGTRRGRGWIRRGWFGRVLGMLVETRFQFSNASGQLRNLLLLERHHRERGQEKVLHRHWRGGPFIWRNPWRWCAGIHRSKYEGRQLDCQISARANVTGRTVNGYLYHKASVCYCP